MLPLTPVQHKFILHWGEMGTRWGINRTVAQIDALLFVAGVPLNAEEIERALGVARSNVSNSLKELQSWGLAKIVHKPGDRRDHFERAGKDPWDTFRQVLDERKKREIDPTVALLRDCVAEAERAGPAERETAKRLGDLLGFFESTTAWYEQIRRLPTPALVRLMKLGGQLRKLLGL